MSVLLPGGLTAEHFAGYPWEARRVAAHEIALLRRLPLSFVPLLLRELIVFDYKFPAERRELENQFAYLGGLSRGEFMRAMAAFAQLRLSPELERTEWVNAPATFSERLTAHLWATRQIDGFRAAAVEYVAKAAAAFPEPALPVHRLGLVALGPGKVTGGYPLFQKLLPHGVLFTRVEMEGSTEAVLGAVARRAAAHPAPYGHWCIDGGAGAAPQAGVAQVSYGALQPVRAALQSRMQESYSNGVFDPEAFRTRLARMQAEEIGLETARDPVLGRFQLSVLTEGSGTQVFATTFVQWTAREALRRAQPLTLLARFAARQRERPMNELLTEARGAAELDVEGSLIDADLGAYYTWVNQQRLVGAEQGAFLVWHEDRAVVIGPGFARGTRVGTAVGLSDLIERIA